MVIKRYLIFGDWRKINVELFICADEQGYGVDIGDERKYVDLCVAMDLWDIQMDENKKEENKK